MNPPNKNQLILKLFSSIRIAKVILLVSFCIYAGSGIALTADAQAIAAKGKVFNVRSYGAVGDGKTLDTPSIQTAMDRCTEAGGGIVVLPGGDNARYVTGTLYPRSNVTLRVEAGATLLGSPNIADYTTDTDRGMYRDEPYMDRCLIFAKDVSNIVIEGPGTIDGQGGSFPNAGDLIKNRPKMFRLLNSTGLVKVQTIAKDQRPPIVIVNVDGVKTTDSPQPVAQAQ